MANHTPEQLMRWEQEGSEYISTGSGSIAITEYDSFGESVSDEKNSITTSRIVACVNACAGIPDGLLQDDDKNIINRYTQHLRDETVRQADLLATVAAQRDELLKCLNLARDDIYTICDAWGATPPEISLTRFRNIIAECEAQNG